MTYENFQIYSSRESWIAMYLKFGMKISNGHLVIFVVQAFTTPFQLDSIQTASIVFATMCVLL